VLVVREGDDLRMMWRVIITENTLSPAQVSIGITDANRIPQFGTHNLIDIQIRTIPKMGAAAK